MKLVLYPEQYKMIYNVSFLSLGSSIYAIYNKHYMISLCPASVFLTSINYWQKPDYSWRRYLDMFCVKLALSCQMIKAYQSEYQIEYYALMFFAIGFYPLGIYYYKKKNYWYSTYAHCALHIFANIANIILR